MPAHTHDGIDWVARLADLRRADEANGPAQRAVADRLIASLPAPRPTVLDVGCGAGGMSAALAAALAAKFAAAGSIGDGAAATAGSVGAGADRSASMAAVGGLAGAPNSAAGGSAGVASVGGPAGAGGGVAAAGVASAGSVASLIGAGDPGCGGALVLVDAVPELLAAAGAVARAVPGVAGVVDVRTVLADLAAAGRSNSAAEALDAVPAADLVWASNVAHHLPDQRKAVAALTVWLAPGGCLALAEGGLSMRCLPWDVGVGEPGLQDRLIAAHGIWFHRMRSEMQDVVRLPIGWNQVLAEAGLCGVTAFSYLVDVPAPLTDTGRAAVVSWLAWMTRTTADMLTPADLGALNRLLDPDDLAYVGRRDDVFLLKASTVYLGWRS